MLLYVDKKKQRRQRLKIIISALSCFLILFANIFHFTDTLHQTEQHLTDFHPLEHSHPWYNQSDVVIIFTSKGKNTPLAILIPQRLNRENISTIALAFSKLANTSFKITFTPEITEKKSLQKLASIFTQTIPSDSAENNVIVSTQISELLSLINSNNLYPTVLHYQDTQKLQKTAELQTLINTLYPLPLPPQSRLEKEKQALEHFAAKYHKKLTNFFLPHPESIIFTDKNLFLQNTGICLTTPHKNICQTDEKTSLQLNIQTALKKLPNDTKPQKLILLTSMQEIELQTPLAEDEGVAFRYGERQTLLLPHEKNEKIDTYTLLKQNAGINPDYQTSDMKFYKFKTMEIDINDNI